MLRKSIVQALAVILSFALAMPSFGQSAQATASQATTTLVPPVRPFRLPPRIGVFGEAQISLQQALSMALANNNDIDASKIDKEEAVYTLTGARGAFDPVIGANSQWQKQVVPIASSLGGSATVRTPMGLFRIAPADLAALGPEAVDLYGAKAGPTSAGPLNEAALWEALKGCFDPEIPVNIVDLGLIYDLALHPGERGGSKVAVKMTLTAPGCGMGPVLVQDVQNKLLCLEGIDDVNVELVWDPAWNQGMMTEAARLQLGLM